MKKLLLFVESLKIGGAERALVSLLECIDKSKFDITVLSIADRGYFTTIVKSITGIKYKYIVSSRNTFFDKLKIKLIYRWLPASMMYRIFVPKGFDTEVAFCEGLSTKIIGASTNRKSKHIAWVHTDLKENNWPIDNGTFKKLEEEICCYKRYDTIIGVSDTVCVGLRDLLENKDIIRIYNLLDVDEIKSKSKVDSEFKPKRGEINIVSVGRLEYVKGFDRLINVVSTLVKSGYKGFNLTIVGDGSEYHKLREIVNNNELQNYVTFTGMQHNPFPIVKSRDLFVCPSRHEGYNLAIAEAMILGLPIISTRCTGPNELLDNGRYGILCENNESAIYNSLKSILDNRSLLDKYSELSRERCRIFQKEKIINQINYVFEH